MAFSAEDAIAELAALRVAVRQLIEIANLGSIGGEFVKKALEEGLAELGDVSYWGPPEGIKDALRLQAQRSYRDLFSDL